MRSDVEAAVDTYICAASERDAAARSWSRIRPRASVSSLAMISKKFALVFVLGLGACGGAEQPSEETEQLAQALPKNGTGSYSCTVEQCNGNLNPFGTCTHSINGVCVECTAGGHVGSCSGPGACTETNCAPPIKAQP
jgi:hypothetical protein